MLSKNTKDFDLNLMIGLELKGDKYLEYKDIIYKIIKIFADNQISFKDSKLILKYIEKEWDEQKINL